MYLWGELTPGDNTTFCMSDVHTPNKVAQYFPHWTTDVTVTPSGDVLYLDSATSPNDMIRRFAPDALGETMPAINDPILYNTACDTGRILVQQGTGVVGYQCTDGFHVAASGNGSFTLDPNNTLLAWNKNGVFIAVTPYGTVTVVGATRTVTTVSGLSTDVTNAVSGGYFTTRAHLDYFWLAAYSATSQQYELWQVSKDGHGTYLSSYGPLLTNCSGIGAAGIAADGTLYLWGVTASSLYYFVAYSLSGASPSVVDDESVGVTNNAYRVALFHGPGQ